MYTASTVKTELINLIGWRQNDDPDGEQLTELTTSSSGLFYNDEHPMLTIDNLLSIAPEYTRLSYPAWDSGTSYSIGDKVSVGGVNYVAIAASTNQTPPNSTYWISLFTKWLKEKTEAGIIRGLNAWLDKKIQQRTAKNLLENTRLFTASGDISEKDINNGQVVGIEVFPMVSRYLAIRINKIGLQFDTDQTITISLFNSRQPSAIQTQAIAYTGNSGLQWYTLTTPWTLDGEGSYYVVYDQSDISGQSINSVQDYHFYNFGRSGIVKTPKGMFFRPTAFSTPGDVSTLWDISANSYTLGTNYGLNLDVSVECDYTALITEQKNQFKTVISKQVAIDLLRELAYNPNSRTNRHESNVDKRELLYEIDGDSQGRPGGMEQQLKSAIEGASMDTTGMDSICLPCRKRAVKYRVV